MRRRGSRLRNPQTEHPFEIDAGASFLIKNETTLEERLFNYSEVIDGTYETWLSGANGGVLEWKSNGLSLFSGATTYIRLVSNSGNPYLNDWEQNANLGVQRTVNMSMDWVITCVLDKELLSANQRLNIGVRGSGSDVFGLQLFNNGRGQVVHDRITGSTGVPDFSFLYPYTDTFKLLTFTKIGGIVKVYINNEQRVKGSEATFNYTETSFLPENVIVLGSKSYPIAASGKITNYQHLKVLTGDLSSFNLSGYNQAIMTKYGII